MTVMSLKSRVDAVLDSADWLVRTSSAKPDLSSLPDKPVVFTRYGGFQIDGLRKRHMVMVILVKGVAQDIDIADGEGLEEDVDRLVDLIYEADDAYPEYRQALAAYEYKIRPDLKRGYVSVMLQVLEP